MIFENLEQLPVDPIFGLNLAFATDQRPNKVNLGVGVYKTLDLKPFILQTVKKAESILLQKETSKEYLPIDGSAKYVQSVKELVFTPHVSLERIYGAQVVGGTGALRVGSNFLQQRGVKIAYIPDPTWDNHQRIFTHAGLKVKTYPYYSHKKGGIDFEALLSAIDAMEEGSLILFHASCHNPTGCDLSKKQFLQLLTGIRRKKLFPFFDLAYQGFGENLDEDASVVRLFFTEEIPFAVAVSHSKNFGLYAERTGALFFICNNSEEVTKVGSHIKTIIRGTYSNPPCHGAGIVTTILQDPALKALWIDELTCMRERIMTARQSLVNKLQHKTTQFNPIIQQRGMFSFTGLQESQVEELVVKYGIYMPKDGRINLAGLNDNNIQYVADALIAVT